MYAYARRTSRASCTPVTSVYCPIHMHRTPVTSPTAVHHPQLAQDVFGTSNRPNSGPHLFQQQRCGGGWPDPSGPPALTPVSAALRRAVFECRRAMRPACLSAGAPHGIPRICSRRMLLPQNRLGGGLLDAFSLPYPVNTRVCHLALRASCSGRCGQVFGLGSGPPPGPAAPRNPGALVPLRAPDACCVQRCTGTRQTVWVGIYFIDLSPYVI